MAPELKLELGGKFGNFVLLNTIALRNHKPDRTDVQVMGLLYRH